MPTFRVAVVLDYDVPDGTDPDEFHDELRDLLEGGSTEFPDESPHALDSVRDIEVQELTD